MNKIKHLGVIMDGNRRWARRHALTSVLEGHSRGADTFLDLCTWCIDAGIPYLTVYAFSTENWKRERTEVDGLFSIMERFFVEELDTCLEKDIRMKVIGDLSRLSPDSYKTAANTMAATAHCTCPRSNAKKCWCTCPTNTPNRFGVENTASRNVNVVGVCPASGHCGRRSIFQWGSTFAPHSGWAQPASRGPYPGM